MSLVLALTYFFWNFGFMFAPKDKLFMKPAINKGEIVFISYDASEVPSDGSKAVVFRCPINNELSVGRVIATAGQTIEIVNKKVFIDGTLRQEPYLRRSFMTQQLAPMLIPRRAVFVLADERFARGSAYYDSRFVGPIPLECLVGAVSVSKEKKK